MFETAKWVRVCLTLAGLAVTTSASAATLDLAGTAEASDWFGESLAVGDFDCDGDDDLVVGVQGEDNFRGAINVVYSGPSGLRTAGNRHLEAQAFLSADGGEWFGNALAAHDFDDDGCDDLAIGTQGTEAGGLLNSGAVMVVYGATGGLDPINSELWHQDSEGIKGVAEIGDSFGQTLASGDFDGDGFGDLAIGAPYEAVNGHPSAGAVNVLYGSASGLTATGNQLFHLDAGGVQGGADPYENFASSLASGDFNGDGRDDLAVGTLGDHVDGLHNAGSVLVLPGSASGLTSDGDLFLTRKVLGITPVLAHFGYDVAAGDFDGNGKDDLAIGAPGDPDGGAVHVLYGGSSGLSVSGAQHWTQSTPGVPSTAADDAFGVKLTTGNFNGGSYDDLAIAAVSETINGADRAGAVTVIFGSSSGLSTQTAPEFIDQDQTNDDDPEELDRFGSALASGDFDGNGFDELVVGVPLEKLGSLATAGAVHVYMGSSAGPKRNSTSLFLRQ